MPKNNNENEWIIKLFWNLGQILLIIMLVIASIRGKLFPLRIFELY
jgi:hypothetical protein